MNVDRATIILMGVDAAQALCTEAGVKWQVLRGPGRVPWLVAIRRKIAKELAFKHGLYQGEIGIVLNRDRTTICQGFAKGKRYAKG